MPYLFTRESITGNFILYRLFMSYKLFTLNSIKFMIFSKLWQTYTVVNIFP